MTITSPPPVVAAVRAMQAWHEPAVCGYKRAGKTGGCGLVCRDE
ncbi:MAG: hypothetical protein ACLRTM_10575 [Clostridium sp.]